jgi:hypothetical protein
LFCCFLSAACNDQQHRASFVRQKALANTQTPPPLLPFPATVGCRERVDKIRHLDRRSRKFSYLKEKKKARLAKRYVLNSRITVAWLLNELFSI